MFGQGLKEYQVQFCRGPEGGSNANYAASDLQYIKPTKPRTPDKTSEAQTQDRMHPAGSRTGFRVLG